MACAAEPSMPASMSCAVSARRRVVSTSIRCSAPPSSPPLACSWPAACPSAATIAVARPASAGGAGGCDLTERMPWITSHSAPFLRIAGCSPAVAGAAELVLRSLLR
eukprot:5681368-Prymnesium_polylepis.1